MSHLRAVDCERHGSRAWRRKPSGNRGDYGAAYQDHREILLRRAGCRPGTGIGGACEICGKPGVPDDPLQADHIVSVADGGGDELANLRAIHNPSTPAEPPIRATWPPNAARIPDNFRIPPVSRSVDQF